jgi:hypothetical protein
MPTLNDVLAGSLAQAVQVQQIIDALKGTPNKGVPVALVSLNDPSNYALTVQNDDPTNSRALSVLKADGTTLISADANGVTLGSPVNLPVGSITSGAIADGTIATADLADKSVTNAKLASDTARANLLTNGGFEIWQRGAGGFTTSTYAADRWYLSLGGGDSLIVSKATTAANLDNSPTGVNFVFTLSGGAGTTALLQDLKISASEPNQLAGRTVSLSIRVKASVANAVRIGLVTDGTGALTFPTNCSPFHTGSGNYETLSVSGLVPTDATFLRVGFRFGTTFTNAWADNAMLVVGSVPADYAPLHPADDLARCLRYYEVIGNAGNYPLIGGYNSASGVVYGGVPYKAVKPVSPTVTKNGTWAVSNAGQPTVTATSVDGATLQTTVTATGYGYATANSGGLNVTVEANP